MDWSVLKRVRCRDQRRDTEREERIAWVCRFKKGINGNDRNLYRGENIEGAGTKKRAVGEKILKNTSTSEMQM